MTDGNGHRDPATPQEIWEILREISAAQQETERRMPETDRQMQETDRRMQETDRQMQETDRRLQATDELITRQTRAADRRMDELDKLFNGQWCRLIESLVEGDLERLLQRRGIAVHHTITNPRQDYGERRWEFDLAAVNSQEVVVVEVQTTLKVPDVRSFRRTVERVSGADAGVRFAPDLRGGCLSQGTPGVGPASRAAGHVCDSRHRQQRQHHQPGGLHPAHVRPPERRTQPPVARSGPPQCRVLTLLGRIMF